MLEELAGATLGADLSVPGPPCLAPVTMLVPTVLSSGGWWVPTLDLLSLALVWAHPCLAGTGGHAVAGSSELGRMVGAIPGPAFAGAGRELTLTGWCRLASSRWLVPLTGVPAQAPCRGIPCLAWCRRFRGLMNARGRTLVVNSAQVWLYLCGSTWNDCLLTLARSGVDAVGVTR